MCVGSVPCQIYIIDQSCTDEQINVLPGGLIRAGFLIASVPTAPHSQAVTDAPSRFASAPQGPLQNSRAAEAAWVTCFLRLCLVNFLFLSVFSPTFHDKEGPDEGVRIKIKSASYHF